MQVHRFTVAKLPRRLRRGLLALLEGMPQDHLYEDLLRHRSYWVWISEFLHPHEYAKRFPRVALGFRIVRGRAPDGTAAPEFRTWHATVEREITRRDMAALVTIMEERPGEFARRLDHLLRLATADPASLDRVVGAFISQIERYATPVLAMLHSHLPHRAQRAELRVYWPKVAVGRGAEAADAGGMVDAPALALLYQGDLALPEGSAAYVLFRERTTPTMEASDLLA